MIYSPGVSAPGRILALTGLVCAALLACPPALADIVLHNGGVNKDRDAAERVTERTGTAPTLVLSSDVLSGPTRVLTGHATIEQCEGAPIALDIKSKLDDIEESVFSYELETAARSLDILSTLAPCASAPIEAAELARMSFLHGATLLDMGDPLAEKSMAESLAFVPDYTGERGFPRAHADMLDAARRRIKTLPDGRIFIWGGPGVEEVYVDGVKRTEEHSIGVVVRPGLHLIQVRKNDELKGMWVRIRSRFSAVIFPGAGRAVWADAGRSPGGELAMSLMLAAEFRGQQGDIHVLHYRGRLVAASTWPALGEGHKRWELSKSTANRRKTKRRGKDKQKSTAAAPQRRPASREATGQQKPPVTAAKTRPKGSADQPTGGATAAEDASPEASTAPASPTNKKNTASATPDKGSEGAAAPKKTNSRVSAAPEPDAGATGPPSTAPAAKRPPAPGESRGTLSTAPLAKSYAQRPFRAVAGGGFHYADPFPYAVLAIDVTYQFFGPLHAVVFLRPSLGAVAEFPVSEGEEPIIGPTGFAPLGGGIGVQRLGRFAPYARIVGQYAHNRDGLANPEHLGGVMIQGGIDFTPKEGSPLIVRVQAEAGFLGAHFNGRVWAGAGINL